MTADDKTSLEERAASRRQRAHVTTGHGTPPSDWHLVTSPEEAKKSMEALWELSCFVYQCPPDKPMDKTIVRMGRGDSSADT
jgi:hypothetical protein